MAKPNDSQPPRIELRRRRSRLFARVFLGDARCRTVGLSEGFAEIVEDRFGPQGAGIAALGSRRTRVRRYRGHFSGHAVSEAPRRAEELEAVALQRIKLDDTAAFERAGPENERSFCARLCFAMIS